MKNIQTVVAALAAVIIIGGGVTSFFVWRNKAKAPNENSTSTTTQNTTSSRKNTDCKEFNPTLTNSLGESVNPLKAGVGEQPEDFPQPFGNTVVCGTDDANGTSYYIFDIEKDKFFEYYGNALKQKEYVVEDVQPSEREGDFVQRFTKSTDMGLLYWYGDKKAFAIQYMR